MRNYIPPAQWALLARIEAMPPVRPVADGAVFNAAIEALALGKQPHKG